MQAASPYETQPLAFKDPLYTVSLFIYFELLILRLIADWNNSLPSESIYVHSYFFFVY